VELGSIEATPLRRLWVLQLPYNGLECFAEVQRMARRAVIGELRTCGLMPLSMRILARSGPLAEESCALAVHSKNNDCSNLCHCDQMLIIIGPMGRREESSAFLSVARYANVLPT